VTNARATGLVCEFSREEGMSSLTAVLWLTERSADVKFRDGECTVQAKCRAHPNCLVVGSAKGGPGAAFTAAVYSAAFEHEKDCLVNKKDGAPA
jgi:hypothetical protein